MNTTHGQKEKGFTIIEVVLVLAIAALIMLMVFLALPALQRGQRDNARKNDVSIVGSAATTYKSNNNGKLPVTATEVTAFKNYIGDLAQYDKNSEVTVSSGAAGALASPAGNNQMAVKTAAQCGTGGAVIAGTQRQAAIQFMLETNGTYQPQCQNV
jgi:prepilin-type N-terminal cleavage/methylation domain-containing protein